MTNEQLVALLYQRYENNGFDMNNIKEITPDLTVYYKKPITDPIGNRIIGIRLVYDEQLGDFFNIPGDVILYKE